MGFRAPEAVFGDLFRSFSVSSRTDGLMDGGTEWGGKWNGWVDGQMKELCGVKVWVSLGRRRMWKRGRKGSD